MMRTSLIGFGCLAALIPTLVGVPGRGTTARPSARPVASAGAPDVGPWPAATFVRIVEGRWRVFVVHPEAGIVDVTDGLPARWPARTPKERRAAAERWRTLKPPRREEVPPPEFARRWRFPSPPADLISLDDQ